MKRETERDLFRLELAPNKRGMPDASELAVTRGLTAALRKRVRAYHACLLERMHGPVAECGGDEDEAEVAAAESAVPPLGANNAPLDISLCCCCWLLLLAADAVDAVAATLPHSRRRQQQQQRRGEGWAGGAVAVVGRGGGRVAACF